MAMVLQYRCRVSAIFVASQNLQKEYQDTTELTWQLWQMLWLHKTCIFYLKKVSQVTVNKNVVQVGKLK